MKKISVFLIVFYVLSTASLAFLSGCDWGCDNTEDCQCRSCVKGTGSTSNPCNCYKDSTGKEICETCVKQKKSCDCSCSSSNEEQSCTPKNRIKS